MTTWTDIANGTIDQDSPVTQPLLTALRDNPIAIAEGSSGAPLVATGWHPYNKTDTDGTEDGKLYDFATDGLVGSLETPAFADGYEYALFFKALGENAGVGNTLEVELYRQTDAAYTTLVVSQPLAGGSTTVTGFLRIVYPRVSKVGHGVQWEGPLQETSATDASLDASFYDATVQKISKARISWTSGSIDAGQIFLLRRREFISG
jgi:hypothetical protein